MQFYYHFVVWFKHASCMHRLMQNMVSQKDSSFLSTEMFIFLVKNDTLTREIYIQENGIFAEGILFSNFSFENNIHLKNRIIYMSRILFYLKRFMYSSHTQKHVVQLGMNSFFSKMCQGHDISQHLLPMLNFLFTRMPTGNAYRFKYDNPILFCNV